ncbi:hypothetical protein [Ornithinimicrobium panacihumi]|uniref:hypothetical protein n=1 Tax=Ornithinimicrobium panacihumi TaxID=2008449 RepID=UPI003F8BA1D4
MRPLKTAALGILIVAFDLNIGAFDLLFDPVGWALVVLGVHRLADRHEGFRWARIAAVVGLVASVFTAVLRRTESVTSGDGGGITSTTSSVVEPFWSTSIEMLAQAGFVIGLCTALIALTQDERIRRASRTLRWALPATDLAALVASLLVVTLVVEGSTNPPTIGALAALLAIPLVIIGLALAIWFFMTLVRASREPTFQVRDFADMIPG